MPAQITGLVLAGGRGVRMEGSDKGLQLFNGLPLAKIAQTRLLPQVAHLAFNANRNQEAYAAFGSPVWPDEVQNTGEYAGPLAGFLTGLTYCQTPYLLTVPCDTPHFPLDLVERLSAGLISDGADLAIAATLEADLSVKIHPVFCLMRTRVKDSLLDFMRCGKRRLSAWTALQNTSTVIFNKPSEAQAFLNLNTLAELRQLEKLHSA
jgi:molybdopterin-guanine dinucleotide biosynthesis protein A